MKHTYFYETLSWTAEGNYYDDKGGIYPLYGEVSIIRDELHWGLDGFLEVRCEQPVRFANCYSISESECASTLLWESFNPALGTLRGSFEIIGNSIVSHYTSQDGVYSGTETLVQRSLDEYYNVGVSFCNGKKMSSWTAMLKAK